MFWRFLVKRLLLIPLVFVLLGLLALSACSSTPTSTTTSPAVSTTATTSAQATTTTAKPPVIELSYNINYNLTQMAAKYCLYFANQINKATNGRVHVTVYPSGTLSPPEAVYQTVLSGVADMGQHTTTYTAGQFLALEATHTPYAFADGWVSSNVNTDFVNHFKPASNADTHFLFAAAPGPYMLQTFKSAGTDLLKPSDVKGKKVRVTGTIGTAITQAWGGTPISITVNETYDAALKGLVDATLLPLEAQKGWKLAEVSRSVTLLPFGYCTSNIAVMNLNKWNSLPKDIQDAITKVAVDMPGVAGQAWWYSDLDAKKFMDANNVKLITPAAADAAAWTDPTKPLIDDYVKRANAAGLPGTDYINYITERAKYYTANHSPATEASTIAFAEKELVPLN
jgi:TRAP-type transport system periplasmic protein